MNSFTRFALLLTLFLACFASGCRKSQPAVAVPPDCQRFLDKYFAALKAKDVATLQDMFAHLSPAETADMSEESQAMMRDAKKKMFAENFQHMTQMFGDFEDYTVVAVKETTLTREELEAKHMQGTGLQGIHTEILCKAKFSKKDDATISLHLYRENPDAETIALAWQFQAPM